MASSAPRRVSLDEFLAFDGDGDTRYQLVRGAVTAMAPARLLHGQLVAELARLIGNRVSAPCRVITEAGLKPSHRDDTYWQADLAVICGPLQAGAVYATGPRLVVEVLSQSTEANDRSIKLFDYRKMSTLRDILLVSSNQVQIEHWQRRGDLWQVRDLGPGDVLTIDGLGIEIALDELYADMLTDMGEGGSVA